MAEWLYEAGIGENRAILVEGDRIIEAAIELPGTVRAGAICPARLTAIVIPGRRGLALLDGGQEALVEPLPKGLTEGAAFHAEILREAIGEPGRPKRARARATDAEPRPGPSLHERIGGPAPLPTHGPDRFEAAGWTELLDEAASAEIAFPGGAFSSRHHYAVFFQGATPLTQHLLTTALIDAETGKLTDTAPMPWYFKALSLSRPLHFGDYGGLPLKLLWAALDLFTIVVLRSGLYLWLGKRRFSLDARIAELASGGRFEPVAAE